MDWKPPSEFPNLSAATMIAYDTETKDPTLLTDGPGNIRARAGVEDGRVVGVSVGVGPGEGEQWYFPFAHENDPQNMDKDQVLKFLRDVLGTNIPKLGMNLLYDLGWLKTEGVEVGGLQYDVQNAEPLINENMRSYALSILCAKYGTLGKDEDEMYKWQADEFGGRATRRQQAGNIWRTPSAIVGPYAESDCREPFEIFEKQKVTLVNEQLWDLFLLETRLVPLLLAMRERGVLVDQRRAQELSDEMSGENSRSAQVLEAEGIDAWASATIVDFCQRENIEFKETDAGNPSFTSVWLEAHDNEVLRRIADVRRFETNCGKFIDGTVLNHSIDGRIHCQFNQLRGDQYGTVTGRFSSSNPNLQNVPKRDAELGPMIRGLFIPEPGDIWFSDDWSQIEYRLLVHYGVQDGHRSAERMMNQYTEDPTTSFHRWVDELTGIGYDRAKNMNFGLVYGMGKAKMANDLGVSIEDAAPIFNTYHETVPFVKRLSKNVQKAAEKRGYIRTLLMRRRRFEMWEPSDWDLSREATPCGFQQAKEQWLNENFHDLDETTLGGRPGCGIKRAYAYRALNALLQGSAADIMKAAMVEIWESGVCEVLGAPLLTVHDELNWSVPNTEISLEAHAEAVTIMNSDRGLCVPMMTESGQGENWAEAH